MITDRSLTMRDYIGRVNKAHLGLSEISVLEGIADDTELNDYARGVARWCINTTTGIEAQLMALRESLANEAQAQERQPIAPTN